MKPSSSIMIVLVALTISGCTTLSNMFTIQNTAVEEQLQTQLDLMDSHLILMRQITTGDYQDQVSLFENIQSEYQEKKSARSQLRQALVLTTSGHPHTDTSRGYAELENVLQQPGDLTTLELNLASVMLNELESIMILKARNAELSSAVSETQLKSDKSGRSNQQNLTQAQRSLRAAQMEIDELKGALDEARAKLDEIKNIEVSSE